MTPNELNTHLQMLLEAHGLKVTEYKDWLLPGGTFPAIRGTWFPPDEQSRVGALSVEIMLDDKRIIDETFAGPGRDGGERMKKALHTFASGTLHVLLAALWGSGDNHHVTTEKWSWSGKSWTVYLGDLLVGTSTSETVDHPPDLMDIIERQLKGLDLSSELHWLRVFYGNIGNGTTQTEALLDNETWPAAETAIAAANWQTSPQFYSTRHFLILKPEANQ